MPHRLLPLLSDHPQSGAALGERLGVGRVTVGTLAHALCDQGVPVQISRAGYALAPGTPTPALVAARLAGPFPGLPEHAARRGSIGQALRYLGTLDSTQDEARRWADDPADPAPHGAVVVAERQSAGRGRRGRTWQTLGGTLVFSVLLRPESSRSGLSLPELALLPLAAGVALQAACGVGGLKWPNDLLTPDRRKLAGILLEAELRGESARRAVLGIGLNVTAAPEGAAALAELRPDLNPDLDPAAPDRAGLLAAVLAQLDHWLTRPGPEILDAWRAHNLTLGQQVEVLTPAGPVRGVAHDLDAHGGLIVQTGQGPQTIHAGDVQLVGQLTGSSP